MTGSCGGGVRPSISSSSVWQTPQVEMRRSTSSGPGSGTGSSVACSGGAVSVTGAIRVSIIARMGVPSLQLRAGTDVSQEMVQGSRHHGKLDRSQEGHVAGGQADPRGIALVSDPDFPRVVRPSDRCQGRKEEGGVNLVLRCQVKGVGLPTDQLPLLESDERSPDQVVVRQQCRGAEAAERDGVVRREAGARSQGCEEGGRSGEA